MKRLNIFIDETGDFGFGDRSSRLFGVSFVFHEEKDKIDKQIDKLNARLDKAGHEGMVHTNNLIRKEDKYSKFSIDERKKIFMCLFQFFKIVKVKTLSIILDKKYINTKGKMKRELLYQLSQSINDNIKYLNKFDKILIYYDNGQEDLQRIITESFGIFDNIDIQFEFDHEKEKLFQVADMLTWIDRTDYCNKKKIKISKNDLYFFSVKEMKDIIREINIKKL